MARQFKQPPKQNLLSIPVLIEDVRSYSEYFEVSDLNPILHAGKNGFLIRGTQFLKQNTDISIEVLNRFGIPVFSTPINGYSEGGSRLISIEIFQKTERGAGKLIIVGTAQTYSDGRPIPIEFQDRPNVRWVVPIQIEPRNQNTSKIRLANSPTVEILEKNFTTTRIETTTITDQYYSASLVYDFEVNKSDGYAIKMLSSSGHSTSSYFDTVNIDGYFTGSILKKVIESTYYNGQHFSIVSGDYTTASVYLPLDKVLNDNTAITNTPIIFDDETDYKNDLLLFGSYKDTIISTVGYTGSTYTEFDASNFDSGNLLGGTDFNAFGQSFEVSSSFILGRVEFYGRAYPISGATGSVVFRLYHAINDIPVTGSGDSGSTTLNLLTTPTINSWLPVDFSHLNITLEPTQRYVITIEFPDGTIDNSMVLIITGSTIEYPYNGKLSHVVGEDSPVTGSWELLGPNKYESSFRIYSKIPIEKHHTSEYTSSVVFQYPSESIVETSNTSSTINFRIPRVDTNTGEIAKVKIGAKEANDNITSFQPFAEFVPGEKNILVESTNIGDVSVGTFLTNQTLQNNWIAGVFVDYTDYESSSSVDPLPMVTSSDLILEGAYVDHPSSSEEPYWFGTKNYYELSAGINYTLRYTTVYTPTFISESIVTNTTTNPGVLKTYLTRIGSDSISRNSSSVVVFDSNPFGLLVDSITTISTDKSLYEREVNFTVPRDGVVYLRFVGSDGHFQFGNIEITPSVEKGFHPDEIIFDSENNILSDSSNIFKIQFLNWKDEPIDYEIITSPLFISGSSDAQSIKLITDRSTFTFDSNGNPNPSKQTSSIELVRNNVPATAVYTLVNDDDNVISITSGSKSTYFQIDENHLELYDIAFGAQTASINPNPTSSILLTVNAGDFEDKIRFVRVKDAASGAAGVPGSDGIDSKVVKILLSDYSIVYDAFGTNPSPIAITASTDIQNISAPTYRWYRTGSLSSQTGPTASFFVPSTDTFNSQLIEVQVTESGLGVARDSEDFFGITPGTDGFTVLLTNDSHTMPADVNGNVTSYAGAGTDIEVLYGGSNLIPVTTTPISGQFSSSVSQSINITGDPTATPTSVYLRYDDPSAMSSTITSASITYKITAITGSLNKTFVKKQSLTKSVRGDDGLNGTLYYIDSINGRSFKTDALGNTSPSQLTFVTRRSTGSVIQDVTSGSFDGSGPYGVFFSSSGLAVTGVPSEATYSVVPNDIIGHDVLEFRSGSTLIDTIDVSDITDGVPGVIPVLDILGPLAFISTSAGINPTTASEVTGSLYVLGSETEYVRAKISSSAQTGLISEVIVSSSINMSASFIPTYVDGGGATTSMTVSIYSGSVSPKRIATETFVVLQSEGVGPPGTNGTDGIDGSQGPGLIYVGEYDALFNTFAFSNTTVKRDVVSVSDIYYWFSGSDGTTKTTLEGDNGQPTGSNAASYWGTFTQFTALATDMLLAQDIFTHKTINVGVTESLGGIGTAPAITLYADYPNAGANPYISIGQSGIQDYGQPGIFLGSASADPKVSFSGSGGALLWNGIQLSISGSIYAVDGVFAGTVTVGTSSAVYVGPDTYPTDDGTISGNPPTLLEYTASNGYRITSDHPKTWGVSDVVGNNCTYDTIFTTCDGIFEAPDPSISGSNIVDTTVWSPGASVLNPGQAIEFTVIASGSHFGLDPTSCAIAKNTGFNISFATMSLKIVQNGATTLQDLNTNLTTDFNRAFSTYYTSNSTASISLTIQYQTNITNPSCQIATSVLRWAVTASVPTDTYMAVNTNGIFVDYGKGVKSLLDLALSNTGGSTGGGISSVVAGTSMSVSTVNNIVTVTHGDSSTLAGVYGTSGISTVTLDGYGHIIAIGAATYAAGDITSVTAGSGLTGGGGSGDVTLDIGAGTGIDVTADAIAVDVSDFLTNGSNNRVVTATGTDAMNAEANLTFDGTDLTIAGSGTGTAADWIATSDIRLKKETDRTVGGMSVIRKLRPISYVWEDGRDNNKAHIGFSAQEVLFVVPEVVYQNSEGYYGIAYGKFVPNLVKAIQELSAEIEMIKEKLNG